MKHPASFSSYNLLLYFLLLSLILLFILLSHVPTGLVVLSSLFFVIRKKHTPFLLFCFFALLFFFSSDVSASNLSFSLELVSVPSHMQIEILESFLSAEDMRDQLATQNISDQQLEDSLAQMHAFIRTLDFSQIVPTVKIKYSTAKSAYRQRYESLIYPLKQKARPRMTDYSSFRELLQLFDERVAFLQNLQQFYLFVEQEVERNKNNPSIIDPHDEELLQQAKDLYSSHRYDESAAVFLTIKLRMDSRAIAILQDGAHFIARAEQDKLPTQLIRDVFASAEDELSVAYYEHLLNQTIDPEKKAFLLQRMESLQRTPGDEYTSIDYKAVQSLAQQINTTVQQTYRINQTSLALQSKLDRYAKEGLNVTEAQKTYNDALLSFQEERFDEAESLFSQAESSLELHRVQATITGVIAEESLGFIQRHRITFISLLIFLILFSPPLFRSFRLSLVDRRITTLKLESTVLVDLIKKAQRERYEQGIIDHPTYTTKMDKYMERLAQVNTDLPVQKDIRRRFEVPTKIESLYLFFKKHTLNLLHKKKW